MYNVKQCLRMEYLKIEFEVITNMILILIDAKKLFEDSL